MFASRVILNPRNLLSRNVLPLMNGGKTVRECHVVGVPPRVKVSLKEKIFYTVVMTFSLYSIPAWVTYYLPDYQKEDRNAYTGK